MNCIEFRRLLLADPLARTQEQGEHLAECAMCTAFTREARNFEARLHDAIDVPAPQALAERILSQRRTRGPALRVWAIAASLFIGVGIGFYLYALLDNETERVWVAADVGDAHFVVAAITYVVDHEARLLREGRSGDPAVLRDALARLGMRIPATGVSVQYLGECPVPGGIGQHVVLRTSAGQVTLILAPDNAFGSRVVVADRDRTAIAVPQRSGGYVLVADHLERLRQAEELLM